MPRQLRPRDDWDALAMLHHKEELEGWLDEEKMESSGEGSATMLAIHGGGDLSRMLIRMQFLEGVKVAKFPDPEPRRLANLAEKSSLPTYFIEPDVENEEWLSYLEQLADEASRLSKMFKQLFARRRFAKTWKRTQPEVNEPPVKENSETLAMAAGLAATWWRVSEMLSNPTLCQTRNEMFAKRLRGALAHLRKSKPDAVMIVPVYQDWTPALLATLKTMQEVEQLEPETWGEA